MTCIVGWVENNKVTIGGDSAGSWKSEVEIRTDEKVFIKKHMIFGFTSSFRMGQIIRYCLKIPGQSQQNDYQFLCSSFIDSLIECLKEKGSATIKDSVIQSGEFLLGYKGKLYSIQSDFQVARLAKNFNACGSGEHYALGALEAMKVYKLKPFDRVKKALEVAAEFSSGVSPPYVILEL